MKSSDCLSVMRHPTVTVCLVWRAEAWANLSCPGPNAGWWLPTGVLVRSCFALDVLSACCAPGPCGLMDPQVALVAPPTNDREMLAFVDPGGLT